MKLKEALTKLGHDKAEPEFLQDGVIACANKCDEVLRTLKGEMTDIERELESRETRIEKLTSDLTSCKESIIGIIIVITVIVRECS